MTNITAIEFLAFFNKTLKSVKTVRRRKQLYYVVGAYFNDLQYVPITDSITLDLGKLTTRGLFGFLLEDKDFALQFLKQVKAADKRYAEAGTPNYIVEFYKFIRKHKDFYDFIYDNY